MLRRRRAKKSAEQQQMKAQQNAPSADQQQQPAPPPPQAAAPAQSTGLTPDNLEQLKQLGALHESGVLTDSEFEAEKQKVLES